MTNIEIHDILTLNDNCTYVVCSKTDFQGTTYFYLMDLENNENIKFVEEKQNGEKRTLAEIKDKDLLQTLLPLFFENAKHLIKEEHLKSE